MLHLCYSYKILYFLFVYLEISRESFILKRKKKICNTTLGVREFISK